MKPIAGALCSVVVFSFAASGLCAADDWRLAKKVGGTLTVYSYGESPYNHGAPFLELEERRVFSNGALAFRQNHSIDATSEDGEGLPIEGDHNARSCEACHLRDGRGISQTEAFDSTGFSVKTADDGARVPIFRNLLSSSVSHKLQGVEWEAKQRIELPGGSIVELVAPVAIVDGEKRPADLRNAPGVYGLGLLEAIPDDEIRKAAENPEFSTFGVRGVVATACQPDGKSCDKVGRFGWKGTVPSLEAQTRVALAGELGIYRPASEPTAPARRSEYERLVTGLAEYLSMLAVPARRIDNPDEHMRGAQLFEETGCAMCHRPSWRTSGREDTNKWVRDQQFYPFTDMLLHDMGEGLADSNHDGRSRFWRTPALWGIGMQGVVSSEVGYLHDGRARNFLEAILWHGGEAAYSVSRFKNLSREDRDRLVAFIASL